MKVIILYSFVIFAAISNVALGQTTARKPPQPSNNSAQEIAEKVAQSLVLVTVQDADGESLAFGSGFFFKPGLVATNLHIFKRAWQGNVKVLKSGAQYKILEVVGIDKKRDICVFRVQTTSIPALVVGDSTTLKVGEDIFVAGNPRGLEGTFSKGIISGLRTEQNLFQIDAAISPGSSGGPVLNSKGEVIGIAAASIANGQNLNFAIPSKHLIALPKNWAAPINSVGALALSDREERKLLGQVMHVKIKDANFAAPLGNEEPLEAPSQLQTSFNFNEEGNEIQTVYYRDNQPIGVFDVSYDDFGFRQKLKVQSADYEDTERTYSNEDNMKLLLENRGYSIVREDEYKSKSGDNIRRTITFDRDGNQVLIVKSAAGKSISESARYDDEGKILEKRISQNDVPQMIVRYRYQFDKRGNWTKQTEFGCSLKIANLCVPKKAVYREIRYFEK